MPLPIPVDDCPLSRCLEIYLRHGRARSTSCGADAVCCPYYLSYEYLYNVCMTVGLSKDVLIQAYVIAETISNNTELLSAFCSLHNDYVNSLLSGDETADIPTTLQDACKHELYAMNLLLALSGVGKGIVERHLQNIPRHVIAATFQDISLWCGYFKEQIAICGISWRIVMWIRRLLDGQLFRVGRLQFGLTAFNGTLRAFRNETTGRVTAFATNGLRINQSGIIDGINGIYDLRSWTTSLHIAGDTITGNPISPDGCVQNKECSIRLSKWRGVLAPGDLVIDVHIPGDGRMDMDACAQSLVMAHDFFMRYFPGQSFRAFCCRSWILDSQLTELLHKDSNIRKFQSGFYLYPTNDGEEETLWRIFGINGLKNGLSDAPCHTSIQKAAIAFMKQGGRFRGGGGFMLADDLPFHANKYRKQTMTEDRP